MAFEVVSSNPVVRAVVEGTAPRAAQLAASRGLLPLAQSDLLEILVAFYSGADAELKENAVEALRSQQPADIESAVIEGAKTIEDLQKRTKVGIGNPACLDEAEQLLRFYREKYFGKDGKQG